MPTGQRADEVSRVLFPMATILDALTTLRNNASAAHLNSVLLEDHEALHAINAARTIFAYFDLKVKV
ncbi:MAG: abortive infection family protein [Corynebacterium sp.]|uniref:abortive infection family protein n=1 Tax=Corynebacterium sp. TaxID=1720 RepID=UPI003F083EAD